MLVLVNPWLTPGFMLLLGVAVLIGVAGTAADLVLDSGISTENLTREPVTFLPRGRRIVRYWYPLLLWLSFSTFPVSLVFVLLYLLRKGKDTVLDKIILSADSLMLEYHDGRIMQFFWQDIHKVTHDGRKRQFTIHALKHPVTVDYSRFEKRGVLLALLQRQVGSRYVHG